jgi:signal transduction histidine kinase
VEINAGLISYDNRPATLAFVHNASERRLLEEERIKRSKLEAVGSLAGGIAHDFNNLLAVILGNIELARIYPKSEEKMFAILAKAEKASLKARDLTKRFLTFSEGSAPFKRLVPLQPIINEALDITVTGENISYRLNIPAELWEVNCDEELVYQVFSSLISNAVESMEGGGKIGIDAENVEIISRAGPILPGKYVKISVKDEGEGIPEEHMPNIFDPYFSTRGRVSQKGLGFGLSIVYSIIKQHAGHIEVDSEVDVGTTVTIYLPVR